MKRFVGVFRYTGRAVQLVWSTHRGLTVALFVLSLVAGFLPAPGEKFGSAAGSGW